VLLTGRTFSTSPQLPEGAADDLQDEPTPLRKRRADVPTKLAAVIHKALAKDPEARFPDARAMRDALAGAEAEG